MPIKVDTTAHAKASIDSTLGGAWRSYALAARYLSETHKDHDGALKYADQSLALQSHWFNNWIKAEILARKGNYAEARKFAQTAWDMGEKDSNFFSKDAVGKALKEWKDKK